MPGLPGSAASDPVPGRSHVEGPPLDLAAVEPLTATIARLARRQPGRVALVLGGLRVTYAGLEARTRAAMAQLSAHGIGAGDCFAWCGTNHPDFLAAMLAAMRLGAVLAPLNWRLKEREIAHILADSGARLAVVDDAFRSAVGQAAGENVALLASGAFADALSLNGKARTGPGDPRAPALLLYTSGTTGSPKGVQLSELAVSAGREMERLTGGFDDWSGSEVLLSPLPLFHIGGICWALCGLVRGCTVVLTNNAAPPALLDLCREERVSRAFMVPQLVRGLIEEMATRGVEVPSLKAIHYGAAPMDPALLARGLAKAGCRFLQYFGMTEMAGTITILLPEDHDPARPQLLRSVGKVLPGSAIEIRNSDGEVVPLGEAGEIWTSGPAAMIGYANRPEQTAQAVAGGWYRTGDGGRLDEAGYLYLTDRIKDMIVTGGENVYPVEVEAVLREHPAVADCAVYGLPDAVWGERVCAAVEVRPQAVFDGDAIAAFVRQQIAGYKTPRQIDRVDALPRTASGKIQRGKLRQQMMEKAGV